MRPIFFLSNSHRAYNLDNIEWKMNMRYPLEGWSYHGVEPREPTGNTLYSLSRLIAGRRSHPGSWNFSWIFFWPRHIVWWFLWYLPNIRKEKRTWGDWMRKDSDETFNSSIYQIQANSVLHEIRQVELSSARRFRTGVLISWNAITCFLLRGNRRMAVFSLVCSEKDPDEKQDAGELLRVWYSKQVPRCGGELD